MNQNGLKNEHESSVVPNEFLIFVIFGEPQPKCFDNLAALLSVCLLYLFTLFGQNKDWCNSAAGLSRNIFKEPLILELTGRLFFEDQGSLFSEILDSSLLSERLWSYL